MDYPEGAIKSVDELKELIRKAKDTKEKIEIWDVWQYGEKSVEFNHFFSLKGDEVIRNRDILSNGKQAFERVLSVVNIYPFKHSNRSFLFDNFWFAKAYESKLKRVHD